MKHLVEHEQYSDRASRREAISSGIFKAVAATVGFSVLGSLAQSQVIKSTVSADDLIFNKLKRIDGKLISSLKSINIAAEREKLDKQVVETSVTNEITFSPESIRLKEELNSFKEKTVIQNSGSIVVKKELLGTTSDILLDPLASQLNLEVGRIKGYSIQFSPQNVEFLLNQAATLLERGMQARAECDELSTKYTELILEIHEFLKLDNNLVEQSKKGLYELDYNKIKSEYEIEKSNQALLISACKKLDLIIDEKYSDANIEFQQSNLYKLNWSGYHFAGFLSDNKAGEPYQHQLNFRGQGLKHIPDLTAEAALELNRFALTLQKASNEIQLENMEASKIASTRRKSYLKQRLDWEKQNIEFKKERDAILREKMMVRLQSATSKEGVLNYVKRILPLKIQFQNDFEEAYARLIAAEVGLQKIYGINLPLPSLENTLSQPSDLFDRCITWVRSCINSLNRFSQSEIFAIIPVSIRRQYKNYSQFIQAYQSGKWAFQIHESVFDKKYHTRLRGISLSVVCLGSSYKRPFNIDGCLTGTVKMPKTLKYRQLDDQELILDNSNFPKPPLYSIGRVFSTERDIVPQVVGGDSIVNCSPLGGWEVSLDPVFRNFYYQKKRNGKIQRRSVFLNDVTNFDDEISEGIVPNAENELQSMRDDHAKEVYSNFPKFIPSDFYDIQLDLHVAYKMK
jgi:hypothetical protein